MKYIFILLGTLLISCNRRYEAIKKELNTIPVSISMIPKLGDVFSIRTKSVKYNNVILLNFKDSLELDIEQARLTIFFPKQRILPFIYQEDTYKVRGYLYIPTFNEVRYVHVFDPEKLISAKLTPYYYKNPIRVGIWTYEDEGVISHEEYDIMIDNKYIKGANHGLDKAKIRSSLILKN
jgi:hypothetical protein